MNQLIKINLFIITAFLGQFALALPNDIEKPLEIQADEASFDQKTGEAIYSGNVFIKQGSIEIQADYLRVSTDTDTKKFSKLEARGNPAHFSQQVDWRGNIVISKGNNIHYSTAESKLEIMGNGYLSRMDNTISADHILYDIKQGTFNAEKTDTGRVSMTLQPESIKADK